MSFSNGFGMKASSRNTYNALPSNPFTARRDYAFNYITLSTKNHMGFTNIEQVAINNIALRSPPYKSLTIQTTSADGYRVFALIDINNPNQLQPRIKISVLIIFDPLRVTRNNIIVASKVWEQLL
ncbi:MAG: hypothetical protein QXW41_00295 [Fervidicoccaceae archaeon]